MSNAEQINYETVLADLEARKAALESAITTIRAVMGQPIGAAPVPPGGGGGVTPSGPIAHDAYLNMSIPEAAKKHLTTVRRKLSTQDIMSALEAGGLPASKYSTVYAVLRRREAQVGDIINMKGDWALQEWYPNYRKGKTAKEAEGEEEPAKAESAKKDAKAVKAATA